MSIRRSSACGCWEASCVTRKKFWESHRFVENNVGMDARFVWSANPRSVLSLRDHTFAVHMIHAANVDSQTDQWQLVASSSRLTRLPGFLALIGNFTDRPVKRQNGYPRARTITAEQITVGDSRSPMPQPMESEGCRAGSEISSPVLCMRVRNVWSISFVT